LLPSPERASAACIGGEDSVSVPGPRDEGAAQLRQPAGGEGAMALTCVLFLRNGLAQAQEDDRALLFWLEAGEENVGAPLEAA
jgi:hypothetical protein